MTKAEFKELAKKYLKLKVEHEAGKVKVCLMFEDTVISSDFIDYTDVVRVVTRCNDGGVYQ